VKLLYLVNKPSNVRDRIDSDFKLDMQQLQAFYRTTCFSKSRYRCQSLIIILLIVINHPHTHSNFSSSLYAFTRLHASFIHSLIYSFNLHFTNFFKIHNHDHKSYNSPSFHLPTRLPTNIRIVEFQTFYELF